ncbi:hypothetical protein RHGRI_012315 [Rhododendron griersonianum]|uniref:Uncharacterized protein n=1 Tax=Rhododendron griersonianum TaxID=479676 RepID=A0AAV6KQM3_9ERIC|nr:hypothetical protein RHGRI_012315 [Rhododendron griersonianum]
MIDSEIASLVPDWERHPSIEENPNFTNTSYCHNCASNVPFKNLQVLTCSQRGCAAVHGRFEEITYQFEGSEQCVTEGAPVASSQSDGINYSDDENDKQTNLEKDEREINTEDNFNSNAAEDYENEIKQELRWLKAKYQMQLSELRDQRLAAKPSFSTLGYDKKDQKNGNGIFTLSSCSSSSRSKEATNVGSISLLAFLPMVKRNAKTIGVMTLIDAEQMFTAKCFYKGPLLPQSLQRAASLPVDPVDF